MAGYCGFSKSNNAVAAEADGLMVASVLAKWISDRWPRLRGVTAADVMNCVSLREWHHSGKFFMEVGYYAQADVRERGVRGSLYKAVCSRRRAKPVVYENCTMKYLLWSGTRKHPTADEITETGVTVTKTPGKVFLVLTGGSLKSPMRKLPTTRGLVITDGVGNVIFRGR